MFKKKISKPKTLALFDEINTNSDHEDSINNSQPPTKLTNKPICKGLQYTQSQTNQGLSQHKPIAVNKDPSGSFNEKEWTNAGKNDKVLDKFMEERLKEFHERINRIETQRVQEDEAEIAVKEPFVLKEEKEMEKLKEVFL